MKKVRSKLHPTKIGVIKTFSLSPKDEIGEIAVECSGCTYYYNNLAELCERWEDYEEQKEYWTISGAGYLWTTEHMSPDTINDLRRLGNLFETKEEAELAVRKLKAWKRMKDKGFRFSKDWVYRYDQPKVENHTYFELVAICEDGVRFDDLDLLFGGEECSKK